MDQNKSSGKEAIAIDEGSLKSSNIDVRLNWLSPDYTRTKTIGCSVVGAHILPG